MGWSWRWCVSGCGRLSGSWRRGRGRGCVVWEQARQRQTRQAIDYIEVARENNSAVGLKCESEDISAFTLNARAQVERRIQTSIRQETKDAIRSRVGFRSAVKTAHNYLAVQLQRQGSDRHRG